MSSEHETPVTRFASVPPQSGSIELVRVEDAPEEPTEPPRQFTAFVPLALLLVILNFSSFRNIVYLNNRLVQIKTQEAPAFDMLKKSSKQTEMFRLIRQDVVNLSATDPVAGQIARTYFLPQRGITPPDASPSPDAPK